MTTENLTVADVLERAADLIEPEGCWTQGAFARNRDGESTGLSEFAGKAVCWCIMGATEAVSDNDAELSCAADRALEDLVGEDVDCWNDEPSRTQAEVVAKLREAATLAREQSNG